MPAATWRRTWRTHLLSEAARLAPPGAGSVLKQSSACAVNWGQMGEIILTANGMTQTGVTCHDSDAAINCARTKSLQ